jgi:hypothetical protein
MNRTSVASRALVVALLLAFVASSWRRVVADDETYAETRFYRDVLSAISRLQNEGAGLDAGVRQRLIAEGESLVDLENSYRPGTTPIQQEIKQSNATSQSLASERQGLEGRRNALAANPNRTQAQIDALQADINDFNGRLNAHNSQSENLTSRVDADTQRLQSTYSAYANRVGEALSAAPTQQAPPAGHRAGSEVPIDRVYVPSPEVYSKQYVQMDPNRWADELKPLVSASNNAMRNTQDVVDEKMPEVITTIKETVIGEIKDKVLERIPGYKQFESLEDHYQMLNEGYSKPTLELFQSVMADLRRAVDVLPTHDGDFADSQPIRFQAQGEEYQRKIEILTGKSINEGLQNAWERDHAVSENEEKPRDVPLERKITHPDAFRWLQRSEK